MQIANGMVILSPENQQYKYGVTPAEALILYKTHRLYSNGTPLGDLFIQEGDAITVDADEKPGEEAYFDQHRGKHVDAKPATPAVTHKRTNAEEVARLKRKYTGTIDKQTTFVATFGNAVGVKLPETFAEIEEITGHIFHKPGVTLAEPSEVVSRKMHLLTKMRADLCVIAVDEHKIKVHSQDTKESIAQAILDAEAKANAAKEKPVELAA